MKTADQIAVMQASLEGKRIESTPRGFFTSSPMNAWSFDASPTWDWHGRDYRVAEPAKEPRRIRILMHKDGVHAWRESDGLVNIGPEVEFIEALPGWKLVPLVEDSAGKIADRLLTDGGGEKGVRLAIITSNGRELGGWGRDALVKHITALHAANFGEVEK